MGTVLEDVTSETISVEDVVRRVEDWETRVTDFYGMIDGWLPNGWRARKGEPMFMHEEMMRKFGVGPKEMPTRILIGPEDNLAKLDPRALWIIGVNGRIDLKLEQDGRHYLIVDMASSFNAPNWQVAPAERRDDRKAVTENWLKSILK